MNESRPDYYPFLNIHSNVELEILKQLDFPSYRNLSLTCRKWYENVKFAPKYLKPQLDLRFITLTSHGFIIYSNRGRKHELDFEHLRTVTSEVRCKSVYVERSESPSPQLNDVMSFISSNQPYLHIDLLRIDCSRFNGNDFSVWEPLMAMTSSVRIESIEQGSDSKINTTRGEEFFEKYLIHARFESEVRMEASVVNMILKQWVTGKRPNLERFVTRLDSPTPVELEEITHGLESYLSEDPMQFDMLFPKIVCPNLPDLWISSWMHDENTQIVQLSRAVE